MDKVPDSRFVKKFFKLFIPLLLVFFSIGLVHTLGNLRDFHLHQQQMAQQCVRVVEKVIRADLEVIHADLLHLSTVNVLHSYLYQPSENSRRKLTRKYYKFSQRMKKYDQISLLDLTGMEVVRIDSDNDQSTVVEQNKLHQEVDHAFFEKILQGQQGDFFVSPLDMNGDRGLVKETFDAVFRAGVPVFDENGQKKGVVIVNYSGPHLVADIQEVSNGFPGLLFLLSSAGHRLSVSGADKNQTFKFSEDKQLSYAHAYPEKWQKISAGNVGQFQQKNGVISFSTFYPGNKKEPGKFFWKIVNELPLGFWEPYGIGFTRRFFLGFLFVSLLLAVGCVFYLKTRFKKADSDKKALYLSRVVEQSRAAIAITDKKGKIEYVNRKFAEVTGAEQDDAVGQNLKAFAALLASDFYHEMWASFETGKEWHGDFLKKKKNGQLHWEYGSITPLKDESGFVSHYVVVKDDINEHEQFERELRRMISFPEENPNIVIESNLQGEVVYVNPAFRKHFPDAKPDIAHPFLRDLHARLADFERKKEGHLDDELEVDGGVFLRRIAFVPEYSLVRVYGVEITHLKGIENALKEARTQAEEGTRLKSIFLANMSHEIRTPLNAILGYTDLMLMDAQEHTHKKRLSIIREAGKKLLALISDILDFSKIEAGKLDFVREEFSISQVAEQLRQMFSSQAREKKLDFQIICEPNVPARVLGDAKRLTQVLANLLNNAFKFTEQGSVSLHCSYENKEVVFQVSDTGIGIRKEMQKIIFAEFQQADASISRMYGGTGLGLSITRRLITLMGGTINLKSDLGTGTVFTVSIPFAAVEEQEAQSAGQEDVRIKIDAFRNTLAQIDTPLKILLAEDNEMNQRLIREMLKIVGLSVVVAENGQEALDKMAESEFHLLLLDMQMPVLDGMETIKKIRAEDKWKDLYVIAMTGEALPGDEEKFLQAGCNEYVAKPVDLEILYGKMYAFCVDKFFLSRENGSPAPVEIEDVAAEEFAPFEISRELQVLLVMTVDVLKKNQKIFNPDQIRKLASSLSEYDSVEQMQRLKEELQHIAATFDDEALPGLIKKLETIVQSQ